MHAFNYCMLLPRPEAQQLAIYLGWLLHQTRGGIIAGVLFILSGFFAILGLSITYALYQDNPPIVALFFGLKSAVLAIVLDATRNIGRRTLINRMMVILSAIAFIAIFFFNISFPVIIFFAALIGWLGHIFMPNAFPP